MTIAPTARDATERIAATATSARSTSGSSRRFDEEHAMAIITWDPVQELAQFRRHVADMFGNGATPTRTEWNPTCEVSETDDDVVLSIELPGVEEKDLQVHQLGSQLTIVAKRQFETVKKDKSGTRRETFAGSFERSFTLPDYVEGERVEATFAKGILRVRLPKQKEVKPKSIPVKNG